MKLLLFDVDATLVLTGGAGLRALNRAFQRLYSVADAMDDIAPQGKTDPAIVREIFHKNVPGHAANAELISNVLESYIEFLKEEVAQSDSYQVLPGISEILNAMSGREGVLLGLATGNVETGARIKLQRGDLNRFFSFGGYGSDAEDRVLLVRRAVENAYLHHGRLVDGQDTFVIGDTPLDIIAGGSAGCRTVGVATGQYSAQQLGEAGADLVIANFRDDRDYFLRSTFIE
jgi:phosphoglycolate phosphatase